MNSRTIQTNAVEADALDALPAMERDHLSGAEIYLASRFWRKINELNVDWLRHDGMENFKRTVNNNYFNWMVSIRSVYFRNMLRYFLTLVRHRPGRLLETLSPGIPELWHRTYTSDSTQLSWAQRKVYALYLLFLHRYVEANDEFGRFHELEEPPEGNPVTIRVDGRRISQDLSNSYLEYSYLRKSLGGDFDSLSTVGEIGAGYGRLAWLLHRLRRNPRLRIVLIDLPVALSVAQWYLRRVLPAARVMPYRSFEDFADIREEFEASDIAFLLPHQLELLPDKYFDLLINISSLQEMSAAQIHHYYRLIDRKGKHFYTKQWIFWTNPEDRQSVPAIIYPTDPRWSLLGARLNPVHTDFFEAVFRMP